MGDDAEEDNQGGEGRWALSQSCRHKNLQKAVGDRWYLFGLTLNPEPFKAHLQQEQRSLFDLCWLRTFGSLSCCVSVAMQGLRAQGSELREFRVAGFRVGVLG